MSDVVKFDGTNLRTPCTPVEDITADIVDLALEMAIVLGQEDGLGLAANQAGSQHSMFVFYEEDRSISTLINPKIMESSGMWRFNEGCLSLPGIFFQIARPKEVRITGLDLNGNAVDRDATTVMGRLFQHEVDHLEGRLIIDMVSRQQRRDAMRRLKIR